MHNTDRQTDSIVVQTIRPARNYIRAGRFPPSHPSASQFARFLRPANVSYCIFRSFSATYILTRCHKANFSIPGSRPADIQLQWRIFASQRANRRFSAAGLNFTRMTFKLAPLSPPDDDAEVNRRRSGNRVLPRAASQSGISP